MLFLLRFPNDRDSVNVQTKVSDLFVSSAGGASNYTPRHLPTCVFVGGVQNSSVNIKLSSIVSTGVVCGCYELMRTTCDLSAN